VWLIWVETSLRLFDTDISANFMTHLWIWLKFWHTTSKLQSSHRYPEDLAYIPIVRICKRVISVWSMLGMIRVIYDNVCNGTVYWNTRSNRCIWNATTPLVRIGFKLSNQESGCNGWTLQSWQLHMENMSHMLASNAALLMQVVKEFVHYFAKLFWLISAALIVSN
jgi:hypothetical protein